MLINHTTEVAKHCILICERNGHWESARAIREKYFIPERTQECALLKSKEKHANSSN